MIVTTIAAAVIAIAASVMALNVGSVESARLATAMSAVIATSNAGRRRHAVTQNPGLRRRQRWPP